MKFKADDKITVKESFWKIESDVYLNDNMKKLAGRTLEVVYTNGNLRTKQDDSNDDTVWTWDENWVELYRPTITWETLKWKDVVVNGNGHERMVLGVLNDLVFVSYTDDVEKTCNPNHKQELKNTGYTIKQPTPEKLELTLDQIAEKYGVDVTNIKIKK